MKTEHQQRVEEFMVLAQQELPAKPCIPGRKVRELRAKLILEEAIETIEALGFRVDLPGYREDEAELDMDHVELIAAYDPNLVEIADGVADLSVVAIGTLSACGIDDQDILEAIDVSNLNKFAPGGHKRADGKWIKPPGWRAPDLLEIMNDA